MFTLIASRDQITNLCSELIKDGTSVVPNGNNYEIKGHGIEAMASYDPNTSVLNVNVVHKPLFISEGTIESALKKALGE